MTRYTLTALGWVALSYPVFHYLGPIAVLLYGLVSIIGFLAWAVARK